MNKFDLIAIILKDNNMQGFSFYIEVGKFVQYDFNKKKLLTDTFTENDYKKLEDDRKDLIYNESFLILK